MAKCKDCRHGACRHCGGQGYITKITGQMKCSWCNGSGKCHSCGGTGSR